MSRIIHDDSATTSIAISENAGRHVVQSLQVPPNPHEGDVWIRSKVGQPGGDVFIFHGGGWSHRDDGTLSPSDDEEMRQASLALRRQLVEEKRAELARRDIPETSEGAW